MADGDEWRRASKYHLELYRNGERQPYNIAAVRVRGELLYELWQLRIGVRNDPGQMIKSSSNVDELKGMV